jgi:hypothetical protein
MKRIRSSLGVVLLGVGSALILAVPAFAQQKEKQVTITDSRIEIHPGTKISESDQKALNEVLGKYNTSLYKIETLKDGNVVPKATKGSLEDKHIDATLAAEVKQGKATGASVQGVQVIDHPMSQPTIKTVKIAVEEAKSKELIQALKPILEKYSKK